MLRFPPSFEKLRFDEGRRTLHVVDPDRHTDVGGLIWLHGIISRAHLCAFGVFQYFSEVIFAQSFVFLPLKFVVLLLLIELTQFLSQAKSSGHVAGDLGELRICKEIIV